MATLTPNYGLTKPAYDESADVGVINDNMDLIDTAIKGAETTPSLTDISSSVTFTFASTNFYLQPGGSVSAYRFGNLIMVSIPIRNDDSVSVDTFTVVGTFSGLPAPLEVVFTVSLHTSASFKYEVRAQLDTSCAFGIRVSEYAMKASNNRFTFVYLCGNT